MKYLYTALITCLLTFGAQADTGNISYEAPTERVDNTPLAASEIGGFRVYDDQGRTVMTLPAGARSFEIPANGQTLFITTYDTDGRESAYSQAIVLPVGKASPKPPGAIIIDIMIGGDDG